ncbi:MAG: PilZ domain-containing protein [gamma proteobacterium symbiont of Bathyaustriella thionipta]|nr:PilZ domain-containing protein [gamma proteobacterium symbiont of Bathyaustriella thionipta]
MLQRLQQRLELSLPVALSWSGLGIVTGETVNLSAGGAFVRTGGISLPLHEPLEFTMVSSRGRKKRLVSLKARVIHQHNQGIGMSFDCFDPVLGDLLEQYQDH